MKRISTLLLAAMSFAVPACSSTGGDGGGSGNTTADAGAGSGDEWDQALAERTYDYGAALRIAALRLTGDLPSMTEINAVGQGRGRAAARHAGRPQEGDRAVVDLRPSGPNDLGELCVAS